MEHLLLSQKGKKIVIKSQSYENENELQEIVKSNPNLINLSSIFESPIMIIGREFDYIDVLGITVDAVPVIIECKRRENPDMRYLIAQVFEYAAKLEEKTYREFDDLVTKYLAGDKCHEREYKGLMFFEAFSKFREGNSESEDAYSEEEFITDLSGNLTNGEFYLIIVVDQISETAAKTIQFLNRKLDRLRIEIIEIAKFSDADRNIYVPNHVNKEIRQTKSQPGKVTFEEMTNRCGEQEAQYIREFKTKWEESPGFAIRMGTKGFSATYEDIPILYVLPTHFRLAPGIKREYGHLFDPLMDTLEKRFVRNLKVGVTYKTRGFSIEKIKPFIEDVKKIWMENKQGVP